MKYNQRDRTNILVLRKRGTILKNGGVFFFGYSNDGDRKLLRFGGIMWLIFCLEFFLNRRNFHSSIVIFICVPSVQIYDKIRQRTRTIVIRFVITKQNNFQFKCIETHDRKRFPFFHDLPLCMLPTIQVFCIKPRHLS